MHWYSGPSLKIFIQLQLRGQSAAAAIEIFFICLHGLMEIIRSRKVILKGILYKAGLTRSDFLHSIIELNGDTSITRFGDNLCGNKWCEPCTSAPTHENVV